jgi:UDP-N-acetylmuramoyl-tripeptide--D-alanyl-D-alanine ligase
MVGVVTNVRPIHLERLGTLERIARAKSELVRALPASGAAVLNGDDLLVRAMVAKTSAERVLTYGFDSDNELIAEDVEDRGLDGILLTLGHEAHSHTIRLPLLGVHSAWTALAAAGTGLVEGLTWEQIVAGLENPGKPIRMVLRQARCGARILDDSYNAGPASTIGALNVLSGVEGRRVAVLGDMLELGAEETRGHRQVGKRAAQVADLVVTVGPRARIIGQTALDEGMPVSSVWMLETNREAIELLSTLLDQGDAVLVKGSRGMAMEEIVEALGGQH